MLIMIFLILCLETCVSLLKAEKIGSSILRKKNDEVKQEQADSSNVISSDDPKKLFLSTSNSGVIDSNEAEAKEMDVQPNEAESVGMISFHKYETEIDNNASNQENIKEFKKDKIIASGNNKSEILIEKIENREINQQKFLDNSDEKVDAKEEINNDIKEEKNCINDNIGFKVKEIEVIPENMDDEDNIQDEELDHEVDEEEIKGRIDFNISNDAVSLIFNV